LIAIQLFALLLAAADPGMGAPIATVPAGPASVSQPAPPPSSAQPSAPPPTAAPAPPPPSAPRHIDDLSKPLGGAVPQGNYEVGVQGAFARAENLQGPLDGTWILSEPGGDRLYRFQLNDPGYRGGPVQGAFQDLNAQGAMGASGFVDGVIREGISLVLNFEVRGAPATVSLEVRPGGTYAGRMTRAGVSREVTLARP
jgi:hypothetical protein